MKKSISLLLLLSTSVTWAQTLMPTTPQPVVSGGTVAFTASGFTGPVNCTPTGPGIASCSCVGTVCTAYAPLHVEVQDQSRGCQQLPNNSPFTTPVDTLPADTAHRRWLDRALWDTGNSHNLQIRPHVPNFYDNAVDPPTQQDPTDPATPERMHFYYGGAFQDAQFPIPSERNLFMEMGHSISAADGHDHHLFTINKATCEQAEIYKLYLDPRTVSFIPGNPTRVAWTTNTVWPIPDKYRVYFGGGTGSWTPINYNGSCTGGAHDQDVACYFLLTLTGAQAGTIPVNSALWGPANGALVMGSTSGAVDQAHCSVACNGGSGAKFSPKSYGLFGGTDAAGLPISALLPKNEEWYGRTRAGYADLGHQTRTIFSNLYFSARYIWPATANAYSISGLQNPLTGATNGANTTFAALTDLNYQGNTLPCDHYTFFVGCTIHVHIWGLTGAWAAANGDRAGTVVDNFHFTVAGLDSTSWGPMPSGGIFVYDFFPYGATVRCKATMDVNAVCGTSTDLSQSDPYCRVYLNTCKKYGFIPSDGGGNYDGGNVGSEFIPAQLRDAAAKIFSSTAIQPIENYLEVVDRSSQQLSTDPNYWMQTPTNRSFITVSDGTHQVIRDILPQGTTIGTDREKLTMAAGVSWTLNTWVNGNVNTARNYSLDSGIPGAWVSSAGVLAMPNCTTKQRSMLTVSSAADPLALPLYIDVTCIPVSSDGAYRLALGNYSGDLLDSTNKTWWGGWPGGINGGFNNWYMQPGEWFGTQEGSWQGNNSCGSDSWPAGNDAQLYSRSISFPFGDAKVELIVPNGSYTFTLYGEPGFGGYNTYGANTCGNRAGQNIYDWWVHGQLVSSWNDGYVLAGNQPYHGYTQQSPPVTINDNMADTIGRSRVGSTYGMNWSSLLIAPATSTPAPPAQLPAITN